MSDQPESRNGAVNPSVKYEPTDLSLRAVLTFSFTLAVVLVVVPSGCGSSSCDSGADAAAGAAATLELGARAEIGRQPSVAAAGAGRHRTHCGRGPGARPHGRFEVQKQIGNEENTLE